MSTATYFKRFSQIASWRQVSGYSLVLLASSLEAAPLDKESAISTPVLPTIEVRSSALALATPTSPVSRLNGTALTLAQTQTLGDTLSGQVAISATQYGPVASRPIIRGLDGDRIRIMQNGIGVADASALSYDHAVPVDPLSVQQIEVIRGPAALRYGGNAIGGVVNARDDRIPQQAAKITTGQLQLGYDQANTGRYGSLQLKGRASDAISWHIDAFGRDTGLLRIPGYAQSARYRATFPEDSNHDTQKRLPNSDSQASGGAVGATWFGAESRLGLAMTAYQQNYGAIVSPDVRLDMTQTQWRLSGETTATEWSHDFLEHIQLDATRTHYAHQEIEDGTPGTRFRNRSTEARLEAHHRALGSTQRPVTGLLGLHINQTDFAALGDEALVPATRARQAGLFVLENWQPHDRLQLTGGVRFEHHTLTPQSTLDTTNESARFVDLPERHFSLWTGAVGGVYTLSNPYRLTANISRTTRAPTFYELYADGPHLATGQYLIGDATLKPEVAWSSDIAIHRQSSKNHWRFGVFYTHFDRFITEAATGRYALDAETGTDGDLAEARYGAVPARFYGVEAEGRWTLAPWQVGQMTGYLGVDARADYTYAENRSTGQSLPRIPPLRLTSGLNWTQHPLVSSQVDQGWQARLEVMHAASQSRTAPLEWQTPSYTLVNAQLAVPLIRKQPHCLLTLKARNLTNADVRPATSYLRDIAPEAARSIQLGIQMRF